MAKPIRRVVTGHDAEGKSVFVMDGTAPHVFQRSTGSVVVTELWETRDAPADNRGNDDAIDRGFRLPPPKKGTVFRIIEYPPDKERLPALTAELARADDGSESCSQCRISDCRSGLGSRANLEARSLDACR